ncbi:MAG TPA: hypothetical protein VG228_01655 [Solirubrobacteraceae bacterium]|nr:hypothetical protein [Solirubrobacteraceae bacterium]
MQRENASNALARLVSGAVAPELVVPAPVAVVDPVAVRVPALAAVGAEALEPPGVAVGPGELPPHPATRSPVTSVATARARARGERVSRF